MRTVVVFGWQSFSILVQVHVRIHVRTGSELCTGRMPAIVVPWLQRISFATTCFNTACSGAGCGSGGPRWDSSGRFTFCEIKFAHLTGAEITMWQTQIKHTSGHRQSTTPLSDHSSILARSQTKHKHWIKTKQSTNIRNGKVKAKQSIGKNALSWFHPSIYPS